MKRLLSIILFLFFPLSAPPVQAQQENIPIFQVWISVSDPQAVNVTEKITYTTSLPKHGIFRDTNIDTFDPKPVFDADFKRVLYEIIEKNDSKIHFKIGDPNQTFTGTKTYTIGYTAKNLIDTTSTPYKLTWNVTGSNWVFPIDKVFVSLNTNNLYQSESLVCLIQDDSGSTPCDPVDISYNRSLVYDQTLKPGSSLIISALLNPLSLDDSSRSVAQTIPTNPSPSPLTQPTTKPGSTVSPHTPVSMPYYNYSNILEKFAALLSFDHPVSLIFLHTPLFIMLLVWFLFGRDYIFISEDAYNLDPTQPVRLKPPLYKPNIPMIYHPIPGFTPGEIGTLIDEKAHAQDVIAEIAHLSNLGYVSITKIQDSNPTDYIIHQLQPTGDNLQPHQQQILSILFTQGPAVSFSMLKTTSKDVFDSLKKSLERSVLSKVLFVQDPRTTIYKFGFIGIICFAIPMLIVGSRFFDLESLIHIMVLAGTLLAFLSEIANLGRIPNLRSDPNTLYRLLLYVPFTIGLLFFSGSEITVFSIWALLYTFFLQPLGILILLDQMPQKTALGSAVALQAQGLKQTIQKGKWRYKRQAKQAFIDEMFPYSIALGVSDEFASQLDQFDFQFPNSQKSSYRGARFYFPR